MSDKPKRLSFSSELVPLVLNGIKTQTRRMTGLNEVNVCPGLWDAPFVDHPGKWCFGSQYKFTKVVARYNVGDIICISEAWQHEDVSCDDVHCGNQEHIYYKATDPSPETFASWRPSIHQPIWACRSWRGRIIDVRCERVHDISESDVRAEGFDKVQDFWTKLIEVGGECVFDENYWLFAYTWKTIHE